jgi:hypothetical protein
MVEFTMQFPYPFFVFGMFLLTQRLTPSAIAATPSPESILIHETIGNQESVPVPTQKIPSKLDPQAAAEFVKKSTPKLGLDLDHIQEIDPEVATILSQTQGVLSLDGLTSLDEPTAKALASSKELAVTLNGLVDISPQVASALGNLSYLELNKLRPSHEVLTELGKVSSTLKLNSLESLDAQAALSLSKIPFRLCLNGIKTITAEAAQQLAGSKAMIEMNGIEMLSDQAADELSKHTGGWSLEGLHQLRNVSLAKTLAEQTMAIDLPKADDISLECLAALVRKTSYHKLGLRTLSDEQARLLVQCGRLFLPRIEYLSPEQIDIFLNSDCRFDLPGLKELSDARLAARLVKNAGAMLNLGRVESMPEDVIHELSQGKSILLLSSLRTLNATMAKELSTYKGNLNLKGLREMSDEVAEFFASREKTLFLSKELKLTPAARKKLEAKRRIFFQ